MEQVKNFDEWRAEKLGYVYFSRVNDLIITESNFDDTLFDYLIDIGEQHKQTGRFFAVEVKSLNSSSKFKREIALDKYKNVSFPALLVFFDTKTDDGYFKWIKKPGKEGELEFDNNPTDIEKLDNKTLKEIVNEVKEWYSSKVA